MTLRLKVGVRLSADQAMAVLLVAVREAFGALPCVVTSGMDGKHKDGSLHYQGLAFDFRTKHMADQLKDKLIEDLRNRLTSDFDILLEDRGGENEHLHVEFDPKTFEEGEA